MIISEIVLIHGGRHDFMDESRTSIAERSDQKLFFNHRDMDYYFSWIIGREATEGSLRRECFEVASQITDGDFSTWQKAWMTFAEEVEAEAIDDLHRGYQEEARTGFLRACTYNRAALFIMDPQSPFFHDIASKMRTCFENAASLFDPPIEIIQVPYQGTTLAGYFCKSAKSTEEQHTMIVVGGIETFAEDCYFMIGPAALEKGYNIIAVDLPGQGMNPYQGLFLEARSEIPIMAVVDYALNRNEVNENHLALFGFSWGGHIVLRGAQYESRIKALIANPATTNIFSSALAQQSGHGKGDPIGKIVFEQIAWRFGVRIAQTLKRLAKGLGFLRFARANPKKISCPTLCMAGESEAKITLKQTEKCFELLPNPKKQLRILTKEEGGAAHCQIDNLNLLHIVIFDWLREIL